MSKKLWMSLLGIGVLAAGIFFGIGSVKTVSANATAQAATTATVNSSLYGMMERNGGRFGLTQEGLADALGITVEQLTTAINTATDKALTQAVANGDITQPQADAIKARGNGFGIRLGIFVNDSSIDYQALLAEALGITTDKLTAAIATAHSTAIADAVTAGEITQEQADLMLGRMALGNSTTFRNSMSTAYKAAIQAAVTDGTISQAQADALLSNLSTNGLMGRRGFGFGMEGMGGQRGGMRGGMGW
jgi:polyhydroxyalkanoate synthesis regulator phasin